LVYVFFMRLIAARASSAEKSAIVNRKQADNEKQSGFCEDNRIRRRAVLTSCLQARGSSLRIEAMLKGLPFQACARAAAIVALAAAAAIPDFSCEAEVAVTCTNPFSGASWQIAIDYDRRTVDSNPARISDTEISWRDAKDGWNYTLNRKSGKLTVILASATGGNFLYDRCSPPN
jgi:hypothetical protein